MLFQTIVIRIEQQNSLNPNGTVKAIRNKMFDLNFCNSYEINNAFDNLTDTAKVVMPKKLKVIEHVGGGQKKITFGIDKGLIMNGDKITITAGYLNPLGMATYDINNLFFGFVTKVTHETPITIEAENYMYILKKTRCQECTWDTRKEALDETNFEGKLEYLIKYLFDNGTYRGQTLTSLGFDIKTDNTNTNIGEWTLSSDNTIAAFLEEIKSKCKFTVYMKYQTLFCGIINYDSSLKNINPLIFHFQKNIIENNLEFKNSEDNLVRLVATGIFKTEINTKKREVRVEEVVGDYDGDTKSWHCLDNFTDAYFAKPLDKTMRSKTLREKALAVYPKYKLTKATGSFTTFGHPRVEPGNIITLQDNDALLFTSANNKYLVKSVTTTGGVGGMRQIIELDFCYSSLTDDEKANYEVNKGFYSNNDANK